MWGRKEPLKISSDPRYISEQIAHTIIMTIITPEQLCRQTQRLYQWEASNFDAWDL